VAVLLSGGRTICLVEGLRRSDHDLQQLGNQGISAKMVARRPDQLGVIIALECRHVQQAWANTGLNVAKAPKES
jgi:hypothetical protein